MSSSASLKALQHRAESQKERWCRQFAIEWRYWLLIAHHLASWRAQPQRGLQVWRVAKSVFRTGGCIARWKPRLMSAIPIVFPTYETIVSRKLQADDVDHLHLHLHDSASSRRDAMLLAPTARLERIVDARLCYQTVNVGSRHVLTSRTSRLCIIRVS